METAGDLGKKAEEQRQRTGEDEELKPECYSSPLPLWVQALIYAFFERAEGKKKKIVQAAVL